MSLNYLEIPVKIIADGMYKATTNLAEIGLERMNRCHNVVEREILTFGLIILYRRP